MCTNIVKQVGISGSGKGTGGWFAIDRANVSYDHPFHAAYEHALNIDFVNEDLGPGRAWRWSSASRPPARWRRPSWRCSAGPRPAGTSSNPNKCLMGRDR